MPEIDITVLQILLVAVCGYLLGSIPFGMVIARIIGLGNLRDIGSGNIGATNVLRTGNKLAAFLTLAFDAGKGAIAVLVARAVFGEAAAQIAGLAAFLGHLFPVWLKFQGGKGVATFLGMLLALAFPIGFAACMTWLAAALVLRMSSGAALISAASAPIWCFLLGYPFGIALTIVFAVQIWWSHRTNIARIIAGAEPKIGKKG
jgi:acyl phosphate:glycerol-3-phosphate acyltransferase